MRFVLDWKLIPVAVLLVTIGILWFFGWLGTSVELSNETELFALLLAITAYLQYQSSSLTRFYKSRVREAEDQQSKDWRHWFWGDLPGFNRNLPLLPVRPCRALSCGDTTAGTAR